VIAGKRLLIALEDLGDLHDVGHVDVWQDVHQLLKVGNVLVPEFRVLQLPIRSFTILA
jgi:hypothetical protein